MSPLRYRLASHRGRLALVSCLLGASVLAGCSLPAPREPAVRAQFPDDARAARSLWAEATPAGMSAAPTGDDSMDADAAATTTAPLPKPDASATMTTIVIWLAPRPKTRGTMRSRARRAAS